MMALISLTTVIAILLVGCFLLVKWHDKKIKEARETRERAIAGGCPFFTDN